MNNSCVFRLPNTFNEDSVLKFGLHKILSNDRTTIFQNDQMRFCVDKTVVRVLIFDDNNYDLLENLRMYFYGEEYENV